MTPPLSADDELNTILDIVYEAGLEVAKRRADYRPSGTITSDAFYKARQSLLALMERRSREAATEARTQALKDAKDAIDKEGVPDPYGRQCWYAVDKLIPHYYRAADIQQPRTDQGGEDILDHGAGMGAWENP